LVSRLTFRFGLTLTLVLDLEHSLDAALALGALTEALSVFYNVGSLVLEVLAVRMFI